METLFTRDSTTKYSRFYFCQNAYLLAPWMATGRPTTPIPSPQTQPSGGTNHALTGNGAFVFKENVMQPGLRPFRPAPGSFGMRPPFRPQGPASHVPARPSQPMSAGNAFRPAAQAPPGTGGFSGVRAPGHVQPMHRPPTPQSFTPPPSPPPFAQPAFTPRATRPEGFAPNPRPFAPSAANPRPFAPQGMNALQFAPPMSSPPMHPPPGHVPLPSAPGAQYVRAFDLCHVIQFVGRCE